MESELHEICTQLHRDTGGTKVLLVGKEGEVLAHAGDAGVLDEETGDALAQVAADAIALAHATGAANSGEMPELQASLPRGLNACATALGDRAALVVVFGERTTLDRVRMKMRRARERLFKNLPVDDSADNPTKS
jgi:predicted regulator of Ras-like GTPase activity (Roadblock/LC7/MglB family)